ncbi:MAG: uroporphyrinogen-III synthase [Congregibacter sp.]
MVADTVSEMRVLVTRPAGQADALMRALAEHGFTPLHLPLLAIQAIDPLSGEERQKLLDLERYDHLVFVSANAARIGLSCIQDYWPQFPAGQHYWAVGESTAGVLEGSGLSPQRPAVDMSSEGLLALDGLADLRSQRVLIVKGEGGRSLIADTLRDRGAQVDSLACYRRGCVEHDSADCLALVSHPRVALILISSGEGLDLLSGLLRPQEHTNLASIPLIVPSPRVVERAHQLGWKNVERAANASDTAVLAATKTWREAHVGEIQH